MAGASQQPSRAPVAVPSATPVPLPVPVPSPVPSPSPRARARTRTRTRREPGAAGRHRDEPGTTRLRRIVHAMGTVFSFDVRGESVAEADGPVADAARWLHAVDALFSPYKPDSEVSRLVRGELTLAGCDPLVSEVLTLCEAAEARSEGWFSARYAGALDPTGLVKGWAVERASRLLAAGGFGDTCINGGGDIQLRGHREPGVPRRVGVSDPLRPGRLVTVIEGADGLAVATSGTGERGCHVVDPRTGVAPPEGAGRLASVTVLADGLTAADAWATAALARGSASRDWLEELPDVEAFAVTADGDTWSTSGFARYAPAS